MLDHTLKNGLGTTKLSCCHCLLLMGEGGGINKVHRSIAKYLDSVYPSVVSG